MLPTLATELGYDRLVEVKSGTDAQAGYLEAIHPGTTPERHAAIRAALLDYRRRRVCAGDGRTIFAADHLGALWS